MFSVSYINLMYQHSINTRIVQLFLFLNEYDCLVPMIFLQEGTAQTLPATRRLKNETIGVLVFPLDQLVHTYLKFLARSEP